MIYLVRHAPTEANARGIVQGSSDVAASPIADPDAHRVPPGRPRTIRASPLRRALAAVDVLFPGESYVEDARLAERAMGELEGLDHATVRGRWPRAYVDGVLDPDFTPPGGEGMRAFGERVAAVLRELALTDGDVHVVTHNGWIRTARFLNGELERDELFVASVPFLEPQLFVPDSAVLSSGVRLGALG